MHTNAIRFYCRVRQDEDKLHTFAASSLEPQCLVVSSQKPLEQKFVDEYFNSDQDILKLQYSSLSQATIYQFNQVFGYKLSSKQFYRSSCYPMVQQALNGVNCTFLLCLSEEEGLVEQMVEDLVNQMEIYRQMQSERISLDCTILSVGCSGVRELSEEVHSLEQFESVFRRVDTSLNWIVSLQVHSAGQVLSQINCVNYQGQLDDALSQFLTTMSEIQQNSQKAHNELVLHNRFYEAVYIVLNQTRFENIAVLFTGNGYALQVYPWVGEYHHSQYFDHLKNRVMHTVDLHLHKLPTIQESLNESVAQHALSDKKSSIQLSHNEQRDHLTREQLTRAQEDLNQHKNRAILLEHNLYQKDTQITALQLTLDKTKLQLDEANKLFKEARDYETKYLRNEELYKDQISQLQHQLKEQQNQNHVLAQQLKIYEKTETHNKSVEKKHEKSQEQREQQLLQILKEEKERIHVLLNDIDYFQQDIEDKAAKVRKLEATILSLNKIIEEQKKRIDKEKEHQREYQATMETKDLKIDELLKQVQLLESKHGKTRIKLEQENRKLKEDKNNLVEKYKHKRSELKPELKDKQNQINELKIDNMKLKSENDQYRQNLKQLEHQLGSIHQELPMMEKQKQTHPSILPLLSYTMQSEIERLNSMNSQLTEAFQQQQQELKDCQNKLSAALNQLESLGQQYSQVDTDFKKLSEDYQKALKDNKEQQDAIEKICEMGHTQMDEVDQKMAKMTQQLQYLQQEKMQSQMEIKNLQQEIESYQENEKALAKQLKKYRRENKEYTRQFTDMNSNLKDIILEKNSEIKNTSVALGKMQSNNISYRSLKKKRDFMSSKLLNLDDSFNSDI